MATQVDFSSGLEEREDSFGNLGISLFQLRIWLGHEVISFTILKSWVLSDLVPWILLLWVTGLHVPG